MIKSMQVDTTRLHPAVQMLVALNKLRKPMYEGTVPPHVVNQRRARNRQARKSRRINRHG